MGSGIVKGFTIFLGLILAIGILIVGFFSLRSYLTQASGTSEVTNARTSSITSTGGIINWETEKETQGIVRYSTDPTAFSTEGSNSLLFAPENAESKSHQVALSLLKPDTTYYYEIVVGTSVYGQGGLVEQDKHLPFSFTTQTASESESTSGSTSNLDENTFKQKFGTNDPLYDLNKDGVVNSTDYLIFLSNKQ